MERGEGMMEREVEEGAAGVCWCVLVRAGVCWCEASYLDCLV